MAADCYTDYTDLEAVKLQKAILSLPAKQQAVFNMRYYDDMDYRQIAEATGLYALYRKGELSFGEGEDNKIHEL